VSVGDREDTYTGQTQQAMHKRINGHRSCFVDGDMATIEKSALALHAAEEHPDDFNIDIFNFMILDSVRPCQLNRRESRAIGELRTNVKGLNRMNIQK
jgi:hypothetical protein